MTLLARLFRRRPEPAFRQLWITDFGPDKAAVARVIAGEWETEADATFLALLDRTPWLYQSLAAGSDTFSILTLLAAPLHAAGAATEIRDAPAEDSPY